MNSLCARSNARSAAASSCVGCGGGDGATGFRSGARKTGLRGATGALGRAVFLARRAGAALREGRLIAFFFVFARAGLRAFEAEAFRVILFFWLRALTAAVFLAAFLAGAFAREPLVIGLARVALRTATRLPRKDAKERGAAEREEARFTVLVIGLLI